MDKEIELVQGFRSFDELATALFDEETGSKEIKYVAYNISVVIFLYIFSFLMGIFCILQGYLFLGIFFFISSKVVHSGFFIIDPNEAIVLILYGTYKGTQKNSGLNWCNPLLSRIKISLRLNNLNGSHLKVNDRTGNPIIIGAVVIWRVKNTAKALFDVLNYSNFVKVQYESAIRSLSLKFAYEKTTENEISLREGHQYINEYLVKELDKELNKAGIEVEDAQISTLFYAPEIAEIMLKRQQADAVIAAKKKL